MDSYYSIDLPIAPYSGSPALVPVHVKSSTELRAHVERFATYFIREMGGAMPFEASETETSLGYVPYKAFLFRYQDRYAGGACFRYRPDQAADRPWLFTWIWIHPFCRRKGVLTTTWPELKRQVDRFRLAPPISTHMQGFLRKAGHSE